MYPVTDDPITGFMFYVLLTDWPTDMTALLHSHYQKLNHARYPAKHICKSIVESSDLLYGIGIHSTYRTPYPPHLMDIPTQPPHTPTRSHAPRGQPTSNLPYVSNPRVKNPSDVPAVPPNTQCQLCLGWGHSAVICRSRDSKCYSCSKHGHLARACPLLSP